jgi:hypothetical protein
VFLHVVIASLHVVIASVAKQSLTIDVWDRDCFGRASLAMTTSEETFWDSPFVVIVFSFVVIASLHVVIASPHVVIASVAKQSLTIAVIVIANCKVRSRKQSKMN